MNFNILDTGTIIYTLFFILILIFTLNSYSKTNKQNKHSFYFLIFLLLLLGGLRSKHVGVDAASYVYYFNEMRHLNYSDIYIFFAGRDPGGFALLKLISSPFISYTIPFFIIQFIFCITISYIYCKYSKNCLIALALFVFLRYHFFLFSAIRQGFALCVILLSYKYIIEEKRYKFLACVCLASFFHFSAIICIIMYPIRNYVLYNKIHYIILIILTAFAIITIAPSISIFTGLNQYLQVTNTVGNLFSLFSSIFIFLYIHFNVKGNLLSKEQNILYNISLLFFLFSILAFRLELAFRIAMYFGFIVPIFIPYLITTRQSLKKVIYAIFIVYALTGIPLSVNPYQFYWNEIEIKKEW